MSDAPAITIPRLDGESARAYAARVRYVTMGPQRSIDKVGQQLGYKSATPPGHITRWSQQFGWSDSARQYDQTLATLAAQAHAAEYQRDLEAHRAEVRKRADEIDRLLDGLQAQIIRALTGRRIEAKDGEIHYIPAMDINSATLATFLRGRLQVADMRAHALDLDRLMPTLTAQGGDDGA